MNQTLRDRLRFVLGRIRERLWVKPLVVCVLSVVGVFVAKLADGLGLDRAVAEISRDSLEALLRIMAASMLVIATFAVSSMVAAYSAAGNTATPRSFSLVVSDDTSQNALSTFIGAFIFSIVALVAMMNGYYEKAGRFALFTLTILVFATVVLTFVRWVDSIARLGRLSGTIDKVEAAAAKALRRRRSAPTLRGVPLTGPAGPGAPVFADQVGYVQRVDVAVLQACAEKGRAAIVVDALPGAFAGPGRPLAHVRFEPGATDPIDPQAVRAAFAIGDERTFDDDPRFGLVVLSEIAGRALSPAVNDPGTAIDVIGTLVRLFAYWGMPDPKCVQQDATCPRVHVPEVSLDDMFDDAFTAIARDGAGTVEVAVRLQKAFAALAAINNGPMREAALRHSRLALERAERALSQPEDFLSVNSVALKMSNGHPA